MKAKILLTILTILLIGCGKKQDPDQTYIVMDESSSTSSESIAKKYDAISKTSHLEGISFTDDSCENNNIQTDILIFSDKIESLGGQINELSSYDQDAIGLQKFLSDSGLTSLNAQDFARAGTQSTMKSCDLIDLTPPKSCWYRTLALGLLSEKISEETGVQIELTSHYRSTCYNEKVGGSKKSDHIGAKAIDFSVKNEAERHRVEQYICNEIWKENLFKQSSEGQLNNISIGLGHTFMHIGLDSVHGRRHWIYDNYIQNNTMPSTCWKSL
ncbi:D-Ala-D-Ala carboxypeptidase family metallohydrolase [Halobacteriovorax sp. HLS]|uniref:D-Ala-D-Ala carboxypeptidase family metallohydrolase n=1 Tax=Halobacteriovorax sp. HLS TaxID=2234000 RepID=UPI0013E3940E|nr:D-Ala-D-Ala carboxypeptidase family metallohydrolase [Halobacteriovorax sp. HLS]